MTSIVVFDFIFSLVGLILLSPFLIVISLLIIFDSKGGVFFIQRRVGRNNKDFNLIKFRTMKTGSSKKGLITIGKKDPRVTIPGYGLRKYKIDEIPQLINVLLGDMSLVGPRPEVRKYVEKYTPEQSKVLQVKPGITSLASIEYLNENEILGKSEDPENTYLQEVMPRKLELNLEYVKKANFRIDLYIIFKTIKRILQ